MQYIKKKSPDVEAEQPAVEQTQKHQATQTQAAAQKYKTTSTAFKDLKHNAEPIISAPAKAPNPTPVPESVPAELPQTPPQSKAFTQADVDAAWEECKQQFAGDMQLKVITAPLQLKLTAPTELTCEIEAQSQLSIFEQKIQPAIIKCIRAKCGITVSLIKMVQEVEKEEIIYSPHERYDYMVQKNPAVELLKQKLDLEI